MSAIYIYIVKDKNIVLLVCSLLMFGAAIWKVSY